MTTEKISEVKKKALLLTCAGLEVRRLVGGLTIDETKEDYEGLKTALEDYFCPASSAVFERYLFRNRVQNPEESICTYVSVLRSSARNCAFTKRLKISVFETNS